ncbi:AAA family ATPase [Streptococcus suis]|nr:AAA family ATPase [Streptococcus suis]
MGRTTQLFGHVKYTIQILFLGKVSMRNIYEVGVGFLKHNFLDAVQKAKSGDTIIVSEGFYELPELLEVTESISIVAKDLDIGKVFITMPIKISSGAKVFIRNINFVGDFLTNNLQVYYSSELHLENCRIERGNLTQDYVDVSNCSYYPLLFVNNGVLQLNNCEVLDFTFDNAILLKGQSKLFVENCSLDGVKLFGQSSIEVYDSDFKKYLQLYEGSKAIGKGNFGIYGGHKWYPIYLNGSSSAQIETLFSHNWTYLELKVEDSQLEVKQVNFAEDCSVKIFYDNSSTVQAVIPILLEATSDELEPSITEEDIESPELIEGLEPKNNAMNELQNMIGLNSVKEKVNEFISIVKFNQKRKEQGLPTQNIVLHSLFLGNPGTGKTTVARLLGELLYEAGVIKENKLVEVDRDRLVGPYRGHTEKITSAKLEEARGGIFFVDEAYTLNNGDDQDFGKIAVNTIMKFMEDNRDDIMVIFAGYTDEMQNFLGLNPGLASRVSNEFNFEDYSADEIFEIGKVGLHKMGYQFDEEYYKRAIVKAYQKEVTKSNARFVRNFNESIAKVLASRLMKNLSDDITTITNEDISLAVGGELVDSEQRIQELLDELNSLVGLQPVKEFVTKLVKKAKVNKKLEETIGTHANRPTYHMIFTGNPGTGKTTVARIIGEIFYHLGFLGRKTVKEVSRPDLVAGYQGQTALKTKEVLTAAMGGVLFVDEAYQLKQSERDEFGIEAIEALITALENHRSDFIAIFAGYTKEMEAFLDVNSGMRSRIPITIEFPDYSPEEIGEIVRLGLIKHWSIGDYPVVEQVAEIYSQIPKNQQANARWARNLIEEIVTNHTEWLYDNNPDDVLAIHPDVLRSTILGKIY